MAREEAEAFVREIEAAPCVRFFRRADGTVITTDCPVGVRRKRTKQAAVAVGVSLLAGATGITATTLARSKPPTAPVADRSHGVERIPRGATRTGQAGEGMEMVMGALPFTEADDVKPTTPKPRVATRRDARRRMRSMFVAARGCGNSNASSLGKVDSPALVDGAATLGCGAVADAALGAEGAALTDATLSPPSSGAPFTTGRGGLRAGSRGSREH
jgi:hypothetical protein